MSDKKTHVTEYCIGLLDAITDKGFEATMCGEFNCIFDYEEDFPGLLEAAKTLTAEEMMDNPDMRKELLGLLESLKSAVVDTAEYVAENG